MAADIIELGAHERMKPEEVEALVEREGHQEMIVLFYDANGDFGLRSSGMSNKDALWLIEEAKLRIMNAASLGLSDED